MFFYNENLSTLNEFKTEINKRMFFVIAILAILSIVIIWGQFSSSTILTVLFLGSIGGELALFHKTEQFKISGFKRIYSSWIWILIPAILGGIFAILFYFIMSAPALSALPFFPHFEQACSPGFKEFFCRKLVGDKSVAYLGFWSFLAGFSDRLVLNVLSQYSTNGT